MAEQNQQPQEENTNASGGYQTTTDSETRKTGVAAKTDAKPTAVPESGSSDEFVEGGPNQGTEKR
ncbi:hypothetical protein G7B40_035105 [Aetokthonos hydrillicola Thurmond2011]|uniref:Uncharacterized protein n=1 Tax=Aetokthonos hydrillicola Thurmond2011 TaxID=2712845 RepID=A0AAP5MDS5_9CYAN|nr:hypothetical protein [Aetokthonos hydrillicola]MBW4590423.1 hypothetical protein [Aetokthonos hydrillicola CCALA 1050]MDR9899749.1 hypothetical protein [Aetokthonos hydrillicola Thurmond2011]